MLTPYGELEPGTYTFDGIIVTVSENGFTETPENPPRQTLFAPNDFIKLFTNEELYAIQVSPNPTVVLGRTEVQTIITFVDLDDPKTVAYLSTLQSIGLLSPERIAEVQAGVFKRS